ncbi:MAG TPA: carboxypeptidase-like regulatory domain-containing protein, partial [Vicinamibacterales bacterium]
KGVLGAHVVAFNPQTGHLVGGFTLNADGGFVLAGLEPGAQVLRAEPLDDADIESFFDATLNIDVNFKVKFYEKLVVVPRGGGANNVEIKVVAK